ncbi:hypothetical protein ACVJDU_003785 [Bradyrhizobium diazoefficiens]
MIGMISEAFTRRSPPRISETAPGRTPMAAARPPLLLPVFSRPRSIIATSNMVIPSIVHRLASCNPKFGIDAIMNIRIPA